MSSVSTVPAISVPALCEYLTDLVEWEVFAQYLPGIEQADIRAIQRDKQGDQKRVLFDKWLQVHPNASWDDVVKALENPAVRENAIAKQLRANIYSDNNAENEVHNISRSLPIGGLSASASPNDSLSVPSVLSNTAVDEVAIDEDVVTKLDSLEQSFCDLTVQVKSGVEATEEKKGNIKNVVFSVQQARSFRIDSLQSVKTTDELFEAIRPHYNFLNCHLIIRIALFLCGIVADKATEYKEGIMKFMKTTKIAYLKGVLQQYHRQRKFLSRDDCTIIEIKVENAWGDQPLWLVEMLVESLFPVKQDELPWYEIVPGSIVMTFIALEHMVPSLIESSRKKTEFMRLMGVISLKIGGEIVWHYRDDVVRKSRIVDTLVSLDKNLIRATLENNLTAIQFLLNYTQVDINTTTRNFNSHLLYSYMPPPVMEACFIRKGQVSATLREFCATFKILMHDIEHVLQYIKKPSGHPDYEFLNHQNLLDILPNLPKSLARRVEYYINSLENDLKRRLLLPNFAEHFLTSKYFPTPFPGSIEVIITLHSVWSNCNLWYVEQLIQLIFTPTLFYQLQWYRVDRRKELVQRVCLLANTAIGSDLAENCLLKNDNLRLSLLGVISVQIDDTVMISNDYSDGYTFEEAIELAKAIGDNEMSDLLQQILNQREFHCDTYSIDNNANCVFHPYPDSTPLMIVCCNDNSQLVQLFLDHNADPNIRNGRGATALMYSTGNSKIFQLLLDHGARTDIVTLYNESLLHFACITGNVRIMEKLLKTNQQFQLNTKNATTGDTPLIIASSRNHVPVVKALLEAGADPDIQNIEGSTALMEASKNGYEEIVELLLQAKADPNIQNVKLKTAVYLTNNDQIVDQLVKAKADLSIHSALLLETYINIDLLQSDRERHLDNEEFMDLHHQVVLNASSECDKLGISLSAAVNSGKISLAKALIMKKANPNIMIDGVTPLMTAVGEGYVDLVEKLLQAQADPNIEAHNGRTSLTVACGGNIVEDDTRRSLIRMLLQANANPYVMDGEGDTVMTIACKNEDIVVLDALLQEKVNPDTLNFEGNTPLIIACSKSSNLMVEKLLQANANPNIQDSIGKTPLMVACSRDNIELVSMLLEAGADPTILNHEGHTALDFATDDILNMLLEAIN